MPLPLAERWSAREERRRHQSEVKPWVEALIAEHGDGQGLAHALSEGLAGQPRRRQRAGRDLVTSLLNPALAQQEEEAADPSSPQREETDDL